MSYGMHSHKLSGIEKFLQALNKKADELLLVNGDRSNEKIQPVLQRILSLNDLFFEREIGSSGFSENKRRKFQGELQSFEQDLQVLLREKQNDVFLGFDLSEDRKTFPGFPGQSRRKIRFSMDPIAGSEMNNEIIGRGRPAERIQEAVPFSPEDWVELCLKTEKYYYNRL
jgi:hypothetical protein